jgi:hypothetical protein
VVQNEPIKECADRRQENGRERISAYISLSWAFKYSKPDFGIFIHFIQLFRALASINFIALIEHKLGLGA